MARLEKRLRPALDAIASRYERLEQLEIPAGRRWAGAREHGVQGNTVVALADRGFVETAWQKGGRRLLCRPTQAGLEEAQRHRDEMTPGDDHRGRQGIPLPLEPADDGA